MLVLVLVLSLALALMVAALSWGPMYLWWLWHGLQLALRDEEGLVGGINQGEGRRGWVAQRVVKGPD